MKRHEDEDLMAKLDAYKAKPTPLMFEQEDGTNSIAGLLEFGGWDHAKKTLTPIQVGALAAKPGAPTISWFFDSLAAAAEAGVLDNESFAQQLFASDEDRQVLVDLLQESGDIWWLNDRHFWALEALGFSEDEATSYPAFADALADRVEVE
jgi:hypothetical protein